MVHSKSYAIVGSGMAGLSCGLGLALAGHRVTLFDKGRRPGGRIATRRTVVGETGVAFNHGAQFATARGAGLAGLIEGLRVDGKAAVWPAAERGDQAWVGTPGMSALAQGMADRLVALGAVLRCDRHVCWLDGAGGLRHVAAADAKPGQVGEIGELEAGFDAILLALPAPQAASLFQTAGHGFSGRMGAITLAPCWAVMAAFETPVPGPDTLRPSEGPLAWIARENSRPGRDDSLDAWTLHAAAAWSRAHMEDDAKSVQQALLAAFHEALGCVTVPRYLAAHRWRHALVETSLGEPCLWDAAAGLGYCGDGCLGPRIEAAFDSGAALAASVLNNAIPATDAPQDRIAEEILRKLAEQGPGRSISPSDVAQALSAAWRPLLSPVRQAAIQLARDGRIDILRKGRPIDPALTHGVIRLRIHSPD